MASTSSGSGVPPGFRFHPTDEELLHFYLRKKVSFEKFDLEVIRDVDLNRMEPWELQERCRIGSAPQNEWYFFSHKDRKYPTGSRTNRATNAGFWKATGRDKCIRNSYKKIGMRKTLVFYGGRAPHGQKTDWIMHEYRLEEEEDDASEGDGSEDGWVVCRVFKKKNFFKVSNGGDEGSSACQNGVAATTGAYDMYRPQYVHHHEQQYLNHQQASSSLHKSDLALHYNHHMPKHHYPHVQVQNLLPDHRPSYDFSVLSGDVSSGMARGSYEAGLDVGSCERDDWAVLVNSRLGLQEEGGGAATGGGGGGVHQMNQDQHHQQQLPSSRGEIMDFWGYGK